MEPFATIEELKGRLDWTLDADEERVGTAALEDASDLARAYAGKEWPDAAFAPRMVRTLVLTACARYMRNPEGYTQSRAGDETLAWGEIGDKAGTVYFTDAELKILQSLAYKSPVVSVGITAWGPMDRKAQGYVPVADHEEKPFPLFSNDLDNW